MYRTIHHHDNHDVTCPYMDIVGVVSREAVPLSSLSTHSTHFCVSVGVSTDLPLVAIDNAQLATTSGTEPPKTPDRVALKRAWLTPSHPPFTPPQSTRPLMCSRKRSKSAPILKTTLSQLLRRPLTVDVERCILSSPAKVGVAYNVGMASNMGVATDITWHNGQRTQQQVSQSVCADCCTLQCLYYIVYIETSFLCATPPGLCATPPGLCVGAKATLGTVSTSLCTAGHAASATGVYGMHVHSSCSGSYL